MATRKITSQEKCDAERILALTGTYDKGTLKKAYLDQVRQWHPDVAKAKGHDPAEAEAMTKRINQAFVALMTLFDGDTATVKCGEFPEDARNHGTYQTAGATTSHVADGTQAYGQPYQDVDTQQGRGAVPRNMAAAVRYTRIVTDSNYVRWFVSGIGPHVVWALLSLAFLLFCGLTMTGVFGAGGIVMFAKLLPVFVIYDVATGRGAAVVGSIADIWAVNRAVKGSK